MFAPSVRAVLVALVAAASCLAAAPSLSLNITGPGAVDGVENLKVVTTLINTGDETVTLLNDPRTILNALPADTFAVTDDDGASPSFIGVLAKYSPSLAVESTDPSIVTVLEPGVSVSFIHDLSSAYDFTDTGYTTYTIEPSNLFHMVDANNDISEIRATVDSAYVAKLIGGSLVAAPEAFDSRATFNGCSASQQAGLNAAALAAADYAGRSSTYLLGLGPTSPSVRYSTWFGVRTPTRLNTVREHFRRISAGNFSAFGYDCSTCTRPDVYAYVYPNQYGVVFLCGAFWNAPLTGTDSRAGTLVHEASHFTVNGGTSDFAYGQAAARQLALRSPDQAILNADSHEYFAENNPPLA